MSLAKRGQECTSIYLDRSECQLFHIAEHVVHQLLEQSSRTILRAPQDACDAAGVVFAALSDMVDDLIAPGPVRVAPSPGRSTTQHARDLPWGPGLRREPPAQRTGTSMSC